MHAMAQFTTYLVYDALGVPLHDMSAKARGDVLEDVARRRDELRRGADHVVDARGGTACNGAARGSNMTANDYDVLEADGTRTRVEVKSAQLKWNKQKNLWRATFQKIKRGCFDKLVLVLYTPDGLFALDYDLDTKRGWADVVQDNQPMANISMCGRAGQTDIGLALAHLRTKHMAGAEPIAFDDARYADVLARRSVGHATYAAGDAPLAKLSSVERGAVLERALRQWDEAAGAATVDPPKDEDQVDRNGNARGDNSTTYDYGLAADDGTVTRLEAKSCLLSWNTSNRRWEAHFQDIHREHHDALRLAIYTPRGEAYAVRWTYPEDGTARLGWSRYGKRDTHAIHIYGPCGEEGWEAALEAIRTKLPPGEWLWGAG
jgi:hypothetical protein